MWSTRQRTLIGLVSLVTLFFIILRTTGPSRSSVLLSYRSVFGFPDRKSLYPYTEENCQPPPGEILKPLNDQDFCPPTISQQHGLTITRRPYFILTPSYTDYDDQDSLKPDNIYA
ncbi:hypothetical protein PGT21_000521 [Puccinia graminis f. sp. tritici]|uniref:Uncharacterized protein n=1 Tax=Puccinia graminis f. sp. tritici TaxID=56615 RepID=A0A5B0P6B4_PUCGR|nr:hypothetical protein PGT21_000521 [Puccinia graminis f. sp. tritici]